LWRYFLRLTGVQALFFAPESRLPRPCELNQVYTPRVLRFCRFSSGRLLGFQKILEDLSADSGWLCGIPVRSMDYSWPKINEFSKLDIHVYRNRIGVSAVRRAETRCRYFALGFRCRYNRSGTLRDLLLHHSQRRVGPRGSFRPYCGLL